jgi:hypothetical protein
MRDHWWWRPGVRPGRNLLAWHILVSEQPEVHALAGKCQHSFGSANHLRGPVIVTGAEPENAPIKDLYLAWL